MNSFEFCELVRFCSEARIRLKKLRSLHFLGHSVHWKTSGISIETVIPSHYGKGFLGLDSQLSVIHRLRGQIERHARKAPRSTENREWRM
jgi:hypothetical protein